MPQSFFRFKQFTIRQESAAMKVTTDACLFGAWCARESRERGIKNLLDAGTGTGLLALMLAQKTGAQITAVEIEEGAVRQASENFSNAPWKDRLQVVHADLLQFQCQQPFDCIVCNPPFYERDLAGPDEKRNTAHHSGRMNMQALLPLLYQWIEPEGIIFLLLPWKRKGELEQLMGKNGLILHKEVEVIPVTRPTRWMVALGKKQPDQKISERLVIKEGAEYSSAFRELLRDYYLYLYPPAA